jgi:hypothetical protein
MGVTGRYDDVTGVTGCNIEMRTTHPYLTIPSIYFDVTHVTPVTTVERIRR